MADKFYGDAVVKFKAMASETNTAETIDGAHFRMWCRIAAEEIEEARKSAQYWHGKAIDTMIGDFEL